VANIGLLCVLGKRILLFLSY